MSSGVQFYVSPDTNTILDHMLTIRFRASARDDGPGLGNRWIAGGVIAIVNLRRRSPSFN